MASGQMVWMDGALVNYESASVPIMTHCLHYGGGVFEGIRIYETDRGRAIFRLREHMQRFLESGKVISLKIPYSLDELCKIVAETVKANKDVKVDYIRPLAYYGTGTYGLNPAKLPTKVAVAVVYMGAYLGEEQMKKGAKLITSSWAKPNNRSAALNAKVCGNYINSVLARLEAVNKGGDECLMLNEEGNVAEGTGENIFMIRRGKLYTTPMTAGILEGITRNSVMEIAEDMGMPVIERDMTRSELYVADEVFMTGTAAEVQPVQSIDSIVIGPGMPGPMTLKLQKTFTDAARGKDKKYEKWLTYV
ncbi:MAG TPA: branched-chain amino acid transaminase [Methanomassiliicoccales archaeon]|nr:branched-chain amino acid transaminase [Methanomassiliicoccales archaeon]